MNGRQLRKTMQVVDGFAVFKIQTPQLRQPIPQECRSSACRCPRPSLERPKDAERSRRIGSKRATHRNLSRLNHIFELQAHYWAR